MSAPDRPWCRACPSSTPAMTSAIRSRATPPGASPTTSTASTPAATPGSSPGSGSARTRGRWTSGCRSGCPGGDLAEYRGVIEQHEMVDTDLEVGAVRYRMVEPMRTWHLTFDADVPVRPACGGRRGGRGPPGQGPARPPLRLPDASRRDRRAAGGRPGSAESADGAGTTGKGHFEQSGPWTGWLEVDGRPHDWDGALGNRDRSWGPRNWGGPPMWRWFSINVDERPALRRHPARHRPRRPAPGMGLRRRTGGQSSPSGGSAPSPADDGLTHRIVHLTVVDKQGRTLRAAGRRPPGRRHRPPAGPSSTRD